MSLCLWLAAKTTHHRSSEAGLQVTSSVFHKCRSSCSCVSHWLFRNRGRKPNHIFSTANEI